jgi:hypothetical protein
MGFNRLDFIFDARGSNDYLQLQAPADYTSATSSREKRQGNSQIISDQKLEMIRSPRGYLSFNETSSHPEGHAVPIPQTPGSRKAKANHFRKADATYYPGRGVIGLIGYGLKKAYNFSLKRKWYFIPRAIKRVGKALNKISIDLIHIDD